MNRQLNPSSANNMPYVRQRHWNLEPLVFALCLVAAVLALNNHQGSASAPQQATPAEPVRTLAAADAG